MLAKFFSLGCLMFIEGLRVLHTHWQLSWESADCLIVTQGYQRKTLSVAPPLPTKTQIPSTDMTFLLFSWVLRDIMYCIAPPSQIYSSLKELEADSEIPEHVAEYSGSLDCDLCFVKSNYLGDISIISSHMQSNKFVGLYCCQSNLVWINTRIEKGRTFYTILHGLISYPRLEKKCIH